MEKELYCHIIYWSKMHIHRLSDGLMHWQLILLVQVQYLKFDPTRMTFHPLVHSMQYGLHVLTKPMTNLSLQVSVDIFLMVVKSCIFILCYIHFTGKLKYQNQAFWGIMFSECSNFAPAQVRSCRSVPLTLKVLNFWKFTCYYSLKPLWSGVGK